VELQGKHPPFEQQEQVMDFKLAALQTSLGLSYIKSRLEFWSKVFKHFAPLPTFGLSVHLPLSTPNTVLTLINPK